MSVKDDIIRLAARRAARGWRRLCKATGKRPIVDGIFAVPGFESEKLSLVIALSQLTEELSGQDGWDSTNPDCDFPVKKDSGDNNARVQAMVKEAVALLKKADTLHGQPLYYTRDGYAIDIDEVFAPTIEGLEVKC